jgi:hypothetical protein
LLLCIYGWSIVSPGANAALSHWTPAAVAQRWQRYHDFVEIIADYPLTGSGLGVSAMVYSSYLFLVQVPFLTQAHNLYLQLAVEQGIPGLIALVGVIGGTLWGLRRTLSSSAATASSGSPLYLLAVATSGAVTAIMVNGLLDGDLYSGPFVIFLFVPFGVAWALYFVAEKRALFADNPSNGERRYQLSSQGARRGPALWRKVALLGLAALAPFLLVAAAFFMVGGLAQLYANIGAVGQTQVELANYHWPQWPLQDLVRRKATQQLSLAEQLFHAALARNPDNVTAEWRLGEIALARGDYAQAEARLAHAFALAPDRRAIRQLLGEIYAIQGQNEQAIQMWLPLDLGQNQLQLRAWWYQMIGDATRARNFQETLQLYEQRTCCL